MRARVFRSGLARSRRRGQRTARGIEMPPTLRDVPDRVSAVESAADGHPEPRTMPAPGMLGDLEHDVILHHDAVSADGVRFDVALDRVEICAMERDKGRGG